MGPIEALKGSSAITKGIKMELFKFGLTLIGINISGFLALIIGFLWSYPTALVANAFMFRKLEQRNP